MTAFSLRMPPVLMGLRTPMPAACAGTRAPSTHAETPCKYVITVVESSVGCLAVRHQTTYCCTVASVGGKSSTRCIAQNRL